MDKYRQEAFDREAAAFGTMTLDQLANAGGSAHEQQQLRDHEAVSRNIQSLPALGGRKPIEKDWLTDAPGYAELHGSRGPDAPPIAELLARADEYDSLIYRQGGAPIERTEPRPQTDEERNISDVLWSEFKAAHPSLSEDTAAVEAAATKVARSMGGLDWNDRTSFYDALAQELSADTGRASATLGGSREQRPRDMIAELHRSQRTQGIY